MGGEDVALAAVAVLLAAAAWVVAEALADRPLDTGATLAETAPGAGLYVVLGGLVLGLIVALGALWRRPGRGTV